MFAQLIAVWLSEKYPDPNKLRDWSVTVQPVPSATSRTTTSTTSTCKVQETVDRPHQCETATFSSSLWINSCAKQSPGCHELQDVEAEEKHPFWTDCVLGFQLQNLWAQAMCKAVFFSGTFVLKCKNYCWQHNWWIFLRANSDTYLTKDQPQDRVSIILKGWFV